MDSPHTGALAVSLIAAFLATLPFPVLYMGYARTRRYRELEVSHLGSSVSGPRRGEVDPALVKEIDEILDDLYNWRNYAISIVMIGSITFLGSLVGFAKLGLLQGAWEPLCLVAGKVPGVVFAGLGGAYLADLVDLAEHARVRNLSSSHFQSAWVRLSVGACLGYLTSTVAVPLAAVWVAFGLGAMPLQEGIQIVVDKARAALQGSATSPPPVESPTLQHLQGMTEEVRKTLSEQKVTSTQHLSYGSAVRLLARTNLEWVVILDFVDQALLFQYLGPLAEQLREFGVRGAIEMANLYEALHAPEVHDQREAKAALDRAATAIGRTPEVLEYVGHTLCQDLTARRLAQLFGSRLCQGSGLATTG